MSKIKNIQARQILDSRGNPTVEVDVITENNILGRFSVPSGASKGKNEAIELRDGGKEFLGNGVLKAVQNVNNIIAPELIGKSVMDQLLIDQLILDLDGTKNKRRLGSNATLGISLATTKAAAKELNIPLYKYIGGIYAHWLPVPLINIVNGGRHSDTSIAFQEFMIVPITANTFFESIQMGYKVFYQLKKILSEKGLSTNVGDEGGFSSNFKNIEVVLDNILEAIHIANYEPYDEIGIALDCAASEFYQNDKYNYSFFEKKSKQENIKSKEEHVNYLSYLTKRYPIVSIEDGMDQNDWEGWKLLTNELGKEVQLVGDDLFVTQVNRLNKGIKEGIANSILIKLNQVGTLTETIETIYLAKKNGYNNIISHRSGDTEDSFIADFSVAFNIEQIKTGSLCRSERTSKYNQLLRIEDILGNNSYYPGWVIK
ncbi:MAG: phosphopyruvate hydratase [Flavobacteriales bacterium]|jgi:enolase|uniref:phosphopyruvate hydratase n=1 Tax=Blattabacterium sp. (Mastotermes darwiniensis) TaxID=39768 RepID=UPI000231DE58|nr:phosphopyruvate hydratase [Blattabacterium sp. (Mastotermes darwiniensis)]AER40652.1 enolase [Blattabacterium sp. (Mastotermes darwiniensis) str. MADAR]MDR1804820.1 phosphopyruvate hydratase [Flavobacteriales bacterium]